ncbi:hypothetical protein Pmar_PMAR009253 [Perkinsus marinus ATCC 50983]|uniref:Uncharacterized protein n=1 Tax=Perkinsus marinus (strain ATCC 50983 / TXsc) TaxID=423536 RepID=C5M0E7_PERM5|nr:hypothetical protein Pmar_PMAR009253 [Perkinsus marinus ATCC 50983]EEQ97554.1 hypothetical protein Pmar_PMAR009253 [Perkinsus marinus ATCC 50983]|eukprot:XP_002764837.1 hypothetical protein Pmar_PMAR009253 [Perkinsus marinus ATCC 50983]
MRRSLERIKPSVAQPRAASTNDVTDGKSVAVSKEKKKRLSSVKEIKDILDCDRPADVYCRFHDSESVLCFAKLPGGDFTDVFYHHLRSNKTQSCQVLTYPSYHAKKGECYKNPAKLEAKWTEAVEEANTSSKGWEKSKARDIEKFRHLIPLQCDIDIEGISFDVSAIYVKFPTAFNGTLSIAFFKSPEEPYKILEFTRAYPTHLARYELRYHSLEPPIDIGAGTFGNLHMRAHVSYDGKKIDVTLPKDYVFFFKTSSGEQSGSKDQMFIFLLGEYNKTFAVMKFGDKWALMTDEAVTER